MSEVTFKVMLDAATQQPAAVDENDDECQHCGEPGNLIMCDHCPASWHGKCLGLSRAEVKALPDSWLCPKCDPLCGDDKAISKCSVISRMLDVSGGIHGPDQVKVFQIK